MSHNTNLLSLEIPDDNAFESQVRTEARLRLLQAHAHRNHPARAVKNHRAKRPQWRHKACIAAAAAFGMGLLWPVARPNSSDVGKPILLSRAPISRGELLASLDSRAQIAR